VKPRKQVDAVLRDIKRQPYPFPEITIVSVKCSCGQGLTDLLRIPGSLLFPRSFANPSSMFFQTPPIASPNDLYIEQSERYGWRWDGTTLRPTGYHLDQQQRAQKEILTRPRAETQRARQSLASHSRYSSGNYFSRPLGKEGDRWKKASAGTILELAPEWIECPQCQADVRVASLLAAHGDVK